MYLYILIKTVLNAKTPSGLLYKIYLNFYKLMRFFCSAGPNGFSRQKKLNINCYTYIVSTKTYISEIKFKDQNTI